MRGIYIKRTTHGHIKRQLAGVKRTYKKTTHGHIKRQFVYVKRIDILFLGLNTVQKHLNKDKYKVYKYNNKEKNI